MPFIALTEDVGGGGEGGFHTVLALEVPPGAYAITASGSGFTDIDTTIAIWRVIAPDTGSVKTQALGVIGAPDPANSTDTFTLLFGGPVTVDPDELTLELQLRWDRFADGETDAVTVTANGRGGGPNGTYLQALADGGGNDALILESVRKLYSNPWDVP